jgi:hypothetical protein
MGISAASERLCTRWRQAGLQHRDRGLAVRPCRVERRARSRRCSPRSPLRRVRSNTRWASPCRAASPETASPSLPAIAGRRPARSAWFEDQPAGVAVTAVQQPGPRPPACEPRSACAHPPPGRRLTGTMRGIACAGSGTGGRSCGNLRQDGSSTSGAGQA